MAKYEVIEVREDGVELTRTLRPVASEAEARRIAWGCAGAACVLHDTIVAKGNVTRIVRYEWADAEGEDVEVRYTGRSWQVREVRRHAARRRVMVGGLGSPVREAYVDWVEDDLTDNEVMDAHRQHFEAMSPCTHDTILGSTCVDCGAENAVIIPF